MFESFSELQSSDFIDITGVLIAGAGVAYTVWRNQRGNQLRATVDLVMNQKQNAKLGESLKVVSDLMDSGLSKWACKEHEDSDEAAAILMVLNNYEFIAASMRTGAFSISLYQRMQHSIVIRNWNALKPFVMQKRTSTGRPTLFQEFEWMAKKFNDKPLKVDNK